MNKCEEIRKLQIYLLCLNVYWLIDNVHCRLETADSTQCGPHNWSSTGPNVPTIRYQWPRPLTELSWPLKFPDVIWLCVLEAPHKGRMNLLFQIPVLGCFKQQCVQGCAQRFLGKVTGMWLFAPDEALQALSIFLWGGQAGHGEFRDSS
jgi:hypothetical protein